MKIRSCTPHVTEFDSIRIIVHHVQIREENLYLLCTLLFSICLIFICRSDQALCQHGHRRLQCTMTNIDSAAPSLARLDNNIAPHPCHLGSAVISRTRQRHRQYDSTSTLRRDQVTSAAPLPAGSGITITSMTRGLGVCFPD
jgi:hypothetical protein